jgi:hypothetical protein
MGLGFDDQEYGAPLISQAFRSPPARVEACDE